MTITDIAALLAKAQLDDNRDVSREVVIRWHEILGPINATVHEALEALNLHRRESVAYLQPAHIVTNLRRLSEDRERHNALEDAGHGAHFRAAPKPKNFEAMSAAWDDPTAFAIEVGKYRAQLADEVTA